jgi:hypothetical protein
MMNDEFLILDDGFLIDLQIFTGSKIIKKFRHSNPKSNIKIKNQKIIIHHSSFIIHRSSFIVHRSSFIVSKKFVSLRHFSTKQ